MFGWCLTYVWLYRIVAAQAISAKGWYKSSYDQTNSLFSLKIHIPRLKSRPESYGDGSKVFNRFWVLITQYRSNLFAAFVPKKLSIWNKNG